MRKFVRSVSSAASGTPGALIGAGVWVLDYVGRTDLVREALRLDVSIDPLPFIGLGLVANVMWHQRTRLRRAEARARSYRNHAAQRQETAVRAERDRGVVERADRDRLQREVDELRRPRTVIQTFVAVWDEGAGVGWRFSLRTPFPREELDEAIVAYESWWNRIAAFVHEHRPTYDLRFREAQMVPLRVGPPLYVVEGDVRTDLETPREFQTRVDQVRKLLRELIDAG